MRRYLLSALIAPFLSLAPAGAQVYSGGNQGSWHTQLITATGATTFTLPGTANSTVYISGCGVGGAGGGGQASANTAGGGGGGAGQCLSDFPIYVTPGNTLTFNVQVAPTGGTAGNNGGARPAAATVTGTLSDVISLFGGNPGNAGAAGTGGTGGGASGNVGATGGGAAGANGGNASIYATGPVGLNGEGGGGGASTAGTAGVGGTHNALTAPAGGGTDGGGGGGNSVFGLGSAGSANGVACSATAGYGGGGGGGGTNASGCNGGPGFWLIRWFG